jgi:hypothetical protein
MFISFYVFNRFRSVLMAVQVSDFLDSHHFYLVIQSNRNIGKQDMPGLPTYFHRHKLFGFEPG